jgi:diguanylate cyclase (GGDEF)-like protein
MKGGPCPDIPQPFDATRDELSIRVASAMCFAAAPVTVLAAAVVHPPHSEELADLLLAMTLIAIGIAIPLLRRRRRVRIALAVSSGILLTFTAVYFDGERHGGHGTLVELFLMWNALYAGFFATRRGIAGAVCLVAASYFAVLLTIPESTPVMLTRLMVVVAVYAGVACTMQFLRNHIDTLVRRLGDAALTDALTQIPNRRGFLERFEEQVQRSRRSGERFTLLVGDVDRFKEINDTFGHPAGDAVLMQIARILRGACRSSDCAGRIGGEEFALLLPATSSWGGLITAERMRGALADLSANGTAVTMSFGLAEFPGHGDSAAELMRAADAALYLAKASGRDRTVIHETSLRPDRVAAVPLERAAA